MTKKKKKKLTKSQMEHKKRLRVQLLSECDDKCTRCKQGAFFLDMHHRHYRTWGKEKAEDVAMLCRDCHGEIHARSKRRELTQADMAFVDPRWSREGKRRPLLPRPAPAQSDVEGIITYYLQIFDGKIIGIDDAAREIMRAFKLFGPTPQPTQPSLFKRALSRLFRR